MSEFEPKWPWVRISPHEFVNANHVTAVWTHSDITYLRTVECHDEERFISDYDLETTVRMLQGEDR